MLCIGITENYVRKQWEPEFKDFLTVSDGENITQYQNVNNFIEAAKNGNVVNNYGQLVTIIFNEDKIKED